MTAAQDRRMDQIIGTLLRTGVILAAAVVLLGGAVYLAHHHTPVTNYSAFQGEPEEFTTVRSILQQALAFSGPGLIQLGLLILIATPVARVAFSFFAFWSQRDWTYVVITAIVLALLLYSLLSARS